MAYSACITPLGCSDCDKYDVFSNPDVYQDGSPVGTASKNNARSLNESRADAIAMQDSLTNEGLIFSVEPNRVGIHMSCFQITVKGWNLGSGSDITSVMLAGISSTAILEQSRHHVTVNVELSGATAGTGDVVIVAGGFSTTLTDGFTYDSTSDVDIIEDFETQLKIFYQSDLSVGWYYFDSVCPSESGEVCARFGPATGDGIFAMVRVDGSGRYAAF
jgi:hypothetical protein